MRILALIEASTVSGPVKNLLQFCEAARTAQLAPAVEMALATFQRDGTCNNNEFVEAVNACNLPLYKIRERFRFDPAALSGLRTVIRQTDPELIETHSVKTHFMVRMSKIWESIPWVAFCHGYTRTALRSPIYNSLDRWSLRRPHRIVAMSKAFEQQLRRLGLTQSRISVLHNAVSCVRKPLAIEEVSQTRRRLGILSNERVVVSIGRLSREKAHIDLIAAVSALRSMQPELLVRLVIVGDGPERGAIERATQAAGLNEQVMLAGHTRDVSPYYDIADIVAIPSLSEGSPNVLLEAMAARVPVVATAVGGIPEIVTHGTSALLVQPRSPVSMAREIQSILCHPGIARTLTSNAYLLAQKHHSPEGRAQSLILLYERVCREGKVLSRANLDTDPVLSA